MAKNLNYENINGATHTVSTIPKKYDEWGQDIVGSVEDVTPLEVVNLYENPSLASAVKSTITDGESVTMLREWVTGNNVWSYVRYGQTLGYVLTQHLVQDSLLVKSILPKSDVSLKTLTALEEALAPSKTWMNSTSPYYHSGNGEWWFAVTLPYTCIDDGTLEEKKDEAKTEAIAYMYEYFDLNDGAGSMIYPKSDFKKGLQSCYVKEYYLSTRPGSQLMMLVTIPAVYIEWLKIKESEKTKIPLAMDKNYCITIPANSIEDLNAARDDISQCLTDLCKKYIQSDIKVTNFDFINEIQKQSEGINKIKFLLEANGIDLGSTSNQTASEDACTADPKYKKIEICFSNDGNYNLLAVYYYNNSGEKTTLSTGLSLVKSSYPFNEPRFGHLFLNHQKLCSLPEPVLTVFFEEYCIDPVPEVEIVPVEEKEPPLTPVQQEQLGIAISAALFLGSMAQQFGLILDGEGENSLGFNCYNSSKSLEAFKLKSMELRDSQFMYGADVANFITFICELIEKSNDDIENEGGSVPPLALPSGPGGPGGPGSFDNAGDWGWAWLFALFGDADSWKDLFNISFGDWKMPTFNLMEGVKKAGENIAKEAKDSMVYSLVKVFLQLNCRALLAGVATLGAIGVAAYLISQVEDDDDETLAEKKSDALKPSPADLLAKDYGAENCNTIIQESIKVPPEDYDKFIVEKFLRCGVFIPSDMLTLPRQYLDGVSSMVSPIEMLALLRGSSSIALLESIRVYTKQQFPTIFDSLNTQSKVSSLFVCLGEETTPQAITKVEEKIKEKALDSDYCLNVAEKLKDIMKNKCPSPEAYNSIYEKEFGSNVEMYQELITLIDDECSNVNLKLYNNPETGEKGLLNSINGKLGGQEKSNDSMASTLLGPAKTTGMFESQTIISGSEYQANLEQVSDTYADDLLISYKPIVSDADHGTATGYQHSKKLVDDAYDNQRPTYRLRPSGENYIYDSLKEKFYYFKNPELPSSVQALVDNNEKYNFSQNSLKLSQNQAVFYAMIDNYFNENSKSEIGEVSADGPPVPYGVFTELLDQEHDFFFRTIFQNMIERYARKVGFAWQGDQTNALNAYSKALSDNLDNILNYEQAKKECTKYFDDAEYDNPNDTSMIGPKQYSMLNGMLYTYVRLHIVEYLAMIMPFYEVFEFNEGGVEQTLEELFPEFVRSYIKEKMIEGLPSGYQTHANDTYDFIKKRMSYQIKEYTGATRALDYYIETNYKSVLNAFNSAMSQVPSNFKKSKNWLQTDNFIYSRKEGLEVHKHAGSMNLFLPINNVWGNSDLSGKTCFTDTSNEPYSLFADGRHAKFRSGMFFIQNYFYFTAQTNVGVDKLYLRGTLNKEHLEEINDILTTNFAPSVSMESLFEGDCKYGARLCYGVAYSDDDDAMENSIKLRAKEMFLNYRSPGNKGNLGSLNDFYISSKKQLSMQKSLICVDGKNMLFNRYPAGSDVAVKVEAGETFTSLAGDPLWTDKFDYEGDDSDYSMVIPIFNVEQDIDKSQSWSSFYNQVNAYADPINDMQVFKDLNDELIKGEQYNALIKNCFSPENMVHFNAVSGLRTTSLLNKENYVQTKNILVSNMQSIINVKSIYKTIY